MFHKKSLTCMNNTSKHYGACYYFLTEWNWNFGGEITRNETEYGSHWRVSQKGKL